VDAPASTTSQQQSIQFEPASEGSFLGLVATLTTVTVTLEVSESANGSEAEIGAASTGGSANQPVLPDEMTGLAAIQISSRT
jgi:hypothetical protein